MSGTGLTQAVEDLSITNFPPVLRARTVVLLKAMNTLAGNYVDSTRAIPIDPEDSPRIIVFLDDVHYENQGDAPPQFKASGNLTVQGYLTGPQQPVVEASTELLGEQMMELMKQQGFLALPVERITAIDRKFTVDGDGEIFEGLVTLAFTVLWTEVFEPLLAPFTGTALPGAYGAPFTLVDMSVLGAAGQTLTSATIPISIT